MNFGIRIVSNRINEFINWKQHQMFCISMLILIYIWISYHLSNIFVNIIWNWMNDSKRKISVKEREIANERTNERARSNNKGIRKILFAIVIKSTSLPNMNEIIRWIYVSFAFTLVSATHHHYFSVAAENLLYHKIDNNTKRKREKSAMQCNLKVILN